MTPNRCLPLMAALLLAFQPALSMPAHFGAKTSTQASSPAQAAAPVNLDLSSTQRLLSSALLGLSQALSISVGGSKQIVNPGQLLTASELVALSQVLSTGKQTLDLSQAGNADGGTFSLGSSWQIDNMVIPQGVLLKENFAKYPALSLSGDLTNAGTIMAFSSAGGTATLTAEDITNEASGVITSLASHANPGSLPLGLSLFATNNFVNEGTISSSQDLTVSAGGTLSNLSGQGHTALLQATNNLQVLSANVVNHGTITSLAGNVNFNTASPSDINLDNTGGQVSAQSGNINFRDASFNQSNNLTITGGSLLSENLNLYSGSGTVTLTADNVSGQLNVLAGCLHTLVASPNMKLGNISITGDPTFYNSNGSIEINGTLSVSEDLSIIASGNIVAGPNGQIIANDGVNGTQVTLIAGASIDASGCSGCSPSGTLPGGTEVPSGQYISVDVSNGPGGNIDFHQSTQLNLINASATPGGGGAGGIVTLVALAKGSSGGEVIFPTNGIIDVTADGSGTLGEVQVLAGSHSGTSITMGSIIADGQVPDPSNISLTVHISTQGAVSDDGQPLFYGSNGDVGSGNFLQGTGFAEPASIIVNGTIDTSAGVLIEAGANLTVNGDIGASTAPLSLNLYAGISTPGNLTVNGNLISNSLTALQAGATGGGKTFSGNIIINGTISDIFGPRPNDDPNINFTTFGTGKITTTNSSSLISAATVSLTAGGGIGSSSKLINLSTSVIDLFQAPSGTFINSKGSGDLSFENIFLIGSLNLTAAGNIVQGPCTACGGASAMNLVSTGGSIGDSSTSLSVFAKTLSVLTSSTGSAYINSTYSLGPLILGTVVVGPTFSLTSASTITQETGVGAVTAGTVSLQTSSGSIGGAKASVQVDADALSVQSTDSAYLKSVGTDPLSLDGTVTNTLGLVATGDIVQGSAIVTADTINLQCLAGSIGQSDTNQLQVGAATLLTLKTGPSGGVYVGNNDVGTLGPSSSGLDFHYFTSVAATISSITSAAGEVYVQSNDALTVLNNSKITAGFGDITLIATIGQLSVGSGSILTAKQGNIYLHDLDTSGGSIQIGSKVQLIGESVFTFIDGTNTPSENSGSPPLNVSASTKSNGLIFWGTQGITGGSTKSTVAASGSNSKIVFDTGGLGQGAISLGGGSKIGATIPTIPGGVAVGSPLTSLDLTSSNVVSLIALDISQGFLSGRLNVKSGKAVGGTLTIPSSMLASTLTAENIPANVSVSFTSLSSPLSINITKTSSTKDVVLNGSETFTGTSSTFDVTSNQNGPVISVGSTGLLSTTGALTLNANGNVAFASGGNVTGNVTLDTSNNGNVLLSGTIGSSSSNLSFVLNGTGTVSGGSITANVLHLTSGTGSFGGNNTYLVTAQQLSVNTGGTAVLLNNSALVLQTSTVGGQFQVSSNGALTVSGVITAGTSTSSSTCILAQNSGNVLAVNNNITVTGGYLEIVNFNTTTGSIVVANNVSLSDLESGTTPNVGIIIAIQAGPHVVQNEGHTFFPSSIAISGSVYAGANPSAILGPQSGSASVSATSPFSISFNSTNTNCKIQLGEGDQISTGLISTHELVYDHNDNIVDTGDCQDP